MAFLDKLRSLLGREDVPPELAAMGFSRETMRLVRDEIDREQSKPPRIALIGETGVGKTLTLRALFGKGEVLSGELGEISHEKACTKREYEVRGKVGDPITIIDMPGLGEDLEADERHYSTYARVLPGIDVALWILKADNRAMTHVQHALRRLIKEEALDPAHLVVALNQVDLLQPGAWDDVINQPSPEQERTIKARQRDAVAKIRKVVKLPRQQIVAYSALRRHNLRPLLWAMLSACENSRSVVLFERASCASFTQLVDQAAFATETGQSHADKAD